ncbi:hypothetical protein ABZT03_40415 [Streptomyces sp. NPDC005574]|uniref:hypothetical protein n=1 Tax=Streptomyces sp. NPDC005574 TaxID=3156891 RepID=UPI0033A9D114
MNVEELRAHAEALGFNPRDQVRWLAPTALARTAVKVLLADVFAGYADKREMQGTLGAAPLRAPLDEPDAQEMWLDFVADLGDGFDSTASVACSVAADDLAVGDARLPRGSLLVLGGDEAYPVGSVPAYRDRTTGPYACALPRVDGRAPLMLALPGNHDWYDGLTAFLRTFTLQRPIGGWQTRQTRSYFVVQLPRHWWLVGLDTQLGSHLDEPQLRYFQDQLSARLQPGDGVILCCAEPTWVKCEGDPDAFDALHWFDRTMVRTRLDPHTGERQPTHASIRLWLTGDKHHYARYAEQLPEDVPERTELPPDPRRRQMVTCGLGGAFLASTHTLPPALRLPAPGNRMREKDDPPACYSLARDSVYPTLPHSRRLARRIALPWSPYWLPRRNPGFWRLTAAVHLAAFVTLAFLFAVEQKRLQPVAAVRLAHAADLGEFIRDAAIACAALLSIGHLVRWKKRRHLRAPRATQPARVTSAVLAQTVVAFAVLAVTVALPFPVAWPGWAVLVACLAVAAAMGAAAGSEAFALWVLSARGGAVADWQMSGQAVEDHKGFLRVHIACDGDLVVHPLVLDTVCRQWDLTDAPDRCKRAVPAEALVVRLIEDPIVIAREAKPP